MINVIEEILIDLDGVLVNTDHARGWDEFKFRQHTAPLEWWVDLDPYPWTHDLIRLCQTFAAFRIATKPPACSPNAATGKVLWMDEHLRRYSSTLTFDKYVITPDKARLASPFVVLIDDKDHECTTFNLAGQHVPPCRSLTFPQPWNRAKRFVSERLEHVERCLMTIADDFQRKAIEDDGTANRRRHTATCQ